MTGLRSHLAATFRRVAVPLAAYYAVTLAVPLANGAADAGARFAAHAVMVLIVPPVAIVISRGVYATARACLRAAWVRRQERQLAEQKLHRE